MAGPADHVTPLKRESSATGGDDADAQPWPELLDPFEDGIDVQGVYLQPPTGPTRDGAVYIGRNGSSNMLFKDGVVAETTLQKLYSAIKGKDVVDAGLADNWILRYSTASSSWVAQSEGSAPTVSNIMQMVIGSSTSSTSYAFLKYLIFGGTTAWGTPVTILFIAYVDDPSRPGDIRIVDVTNGGNVICEQTNITTTTPFILNMGTLSNLSAGQAVWQIQAKKTGGGTNKVYVEACSIQMG